MPKTDGPIDLDHLNRFTGGDRAINAEILCLFDNQCREMLARLEILAGAEIDIKAWREITHTLKGAARGVGASDLGDATAQAEQAADDRATALAALQRLKQNCAAVYVFIAQFLNGSA